jgi:predicted transcriptional regulator
MVMRDHDYRGPLAEVDDDVLLIEWDLAVDKNHLAEFARRAFAHPNRVRVAPYWLYHYSSGNDRPNPIWVHRRYIGNPQTGRLVHVTEDDSTCHLWGLGLTYLPRYVVRAYLADRTEPLTDGHLSGWHYQHVEREVAYTTALTLVRILEQKGYVDHAPHPDGGRAHVYRALVPREGARKRHVKDLVDRLFGGRSDSLVLGLLDDDVLGEAELAELRKQIDQKLAGSASKKGKR